MSQFPQTSSDKSQPTDLIKDEEVAITNTLILTGFDNESLKDSTFIQDLQQDIITEIDSNPEEYGTGDAINDGSIIKFIVLTAFKRIIIVLQNHKQSVSLYAVIPKILAKHQITAGANIKVGFSLFDYNNQISELDTLQIPANVKLFLISPPVSPPNGFEYDRLEDPPTNHQIFTLEEIQNLQSQHIPTPMDQKLEVHEKHKHEHPTWEILLNDSQVPDVPRIILNPSLNQDDEMDELDTNNTQTGTYHGQFMRSVRPYVRTVMPQRSIFDEVDGSDIEEEIDYS
ncbi:hypothetical protein WICPIJ_007252 [Wickerhamomyces pijperi]|uniref:Uncharacterized protein n=1 Tax=Wickerhamomyces pijperi TaxID=599730 RepID=A0A9P8Q081_WICPI|nr:hypothetical protein WICPIJ_007252 [Wickerhamomyces pijperi]